MWLMFTMLKYGSGMSHQSDFSLRNVVEVKTLMEFTSTLVKNHLHSSVLTFMRQNLELLIKEISLLR